MSTKVKLRGTTSVKVKKYPVKAGSQHTDKTGGIFTAKVAAIARQRKRRKEWVKR